MAANTLRDKATYTVETSFGTNQITINELILLVGNYHISGTF